MKPVDFPEANRELAPPDGLENCDPLNVLVGEDGSCMSVWEMDAAELVALKVNGGRICVWVCYGNGTQPPISLTVPAPWEVSDLTPVNHDSTNKGPTVKADEAKDLRAIVTAMRTDNVETVAIDVGLFERLVHTVEKRDEDAPLTIVGKLPSGVAEMIAAYDAAPIDVQAAIVRELGARG